MCVAFGVFPHRVGIAPEPRMAPHRRGRPPADPPVARSLRERHPDAGRIRERASERRQAPTLPVSRRPCASAVRSSAANHASAPRWRPGRARPCRSRTIPRSHAPREPPERGPSPPSSARAPGRPCSSLRRTRDPCRYPRRPRLGAGPGPKGVTASHRGRARRLACPRARGAAATGRLPPPLYAAPSPTRCAGPAIPPGMRTKCRRRLPASAPCSAAPPRPPRSLVRR